MVPSSTQGPLTGIEGWLWGGFEREVCDRTKIGHLGSKRKKTRTSAFWFPIVTRDNFLYKACPPLPPFLRFKFSPHTRRQTAPLPAAALYPYPAVHFPFNIFLPPHPGYFCYDFLPLCILYIVLCSPTSHCTLDSSSILTLGGDQGNP